MKAYTITNTVNGKKYVGITSCQLQKRMREHKSEANRGSNKPLYKAMRKYGIDAFVMDLVAEAASIDELKQIEVSLIEALNTYFPNGAGYNLTLGGEKRTALTVVKGEQNYRALLTEAMVQFIRSPDRAHESNGALVEEVHKIFNVSVSRDCLRDARRGTSWKHLNEKYPPVQTGQGTRKKPISEANRSRAVEVLDKHRAVALKLSADKRRGRRSSHAKLSEDTVRAIFYSPLSLTKTAEAFGVSKSVVTGIKRRKLHKYLTESL